jgi:hypothetical protein
MAQYSPKGLYLGLLWMECLVLSIPSVTALGKWDSLGFNKLQAQKDRVYR